MKFHRAIAVIALLGLSLPTTAAHAAEIKLLEGNALNAVMEDLGPQFEKATENKLVVTLGTSAQLKARIESGEAFDAVLLTKAALDELATAGKVADVPRLAIARAGIGVAIRKGAAKPDLSTTDAFKQAMLNAKSIGFVDQTPTAAALKAIFVKLGIADEIKSKIKPLTIQAAVAVTNGDVEIAHDPDQRNSALSRRRAGRSAAAGHSNLYDVLRRHQRGGEKCRSGQLP